MKITRKHIGKTIAFLPILLGTLYLFMGVIGCIEAFKDRALTMCLICACIFVSGGIIITIGLQVLIKYSINGLRNMCGLIGLSVFSLAEWSLSQVMNSASDLKGITMLSAIAVMPFIVGLVVYKLSFRFFSRQG